jgi:hypothetical protein
VGDAQAREHGGLEGDDAGGVDDPVQHSSESRQKMGDKYN